VRATVKQALSGLDGSGDRSGLRVLIYHRVGGGSPDERDTPAARFAEQVEVLAAQRVLALDDALDELAAGDDAPKIVLTFDDGFADVHTHAWPLLREHRLPFVVYLATGYVGGQMHWEGSTAKASGPALSWEQLGEMLASGLCTIGNHTNTHARPEALSEAELDRCTQAIETELGATPRHFAYTWGIRVPAMEPALRVRFRSAVTGELGINRPGSDPLRLARIPVRGSDPLAFFRAKLSGSLRAERAYAGIVSAAKRVGLRA
jgi:peptidoglycan/xylan/chitin deacetylase (PgdA/CDA1 family)